MISLLISLMLVFTSCTNSAPKQFSQTVYNDTCRSMTDAENLKNKKAVIFGKLKKFTPLKEGKGRGHMFRQWEIVFPGGGRIPVVNKDKSDSESIVFDEYANQNVIIYGKVFFGIIIGDSDPSHQSATGYRIDADGIANITNTKQSANIDTCWIYLDIQAHPNLEAIVAGKLIEYVPPYDNSKLGDEKIWDYKLLMQDGYSVPLDKSSDINLESFKNKDVFIKAFVKYGIIFGDTNTANMQGYRIDPVEIYANEKGYGNTLTERKIRIDLTKFNDEGYRIHPDGEKSSTSYEFCIPAGDSFLSVVKAIDSTASEMKGSQGRSDCGDMEWLVIGNTRQTGFKNVLKRLSELKYIRKITETFWE